jgi:hypothetical protein
MKNAERVALSPKEFAALFGKSQTWGYRQIYAGKVKTITEYGRILIPAAEVERILGEAGIYDGPKVKISKEEGRLDGWRQFINDRRQIKAVTNGGRVQKFDRSQIGKPDARAAALARLTKRN